MSGRVLFGVYLALYSAFVLTNAFAPGVMERTPVAGLNVAVLSGFGLIVAAVLMALLYEWLGPGGPAVVEGDSVDEADPDAAGNDGGPT
ncbi:MAG: DUF485 domain-containing protein [Planctomycetota bacterium]